MVPIHSNAEGPSLENLRTENPDATEPAPSRLPIDRLGACSPRRLLFLLPLFPPARWLWALLPQPRVSSSTPPRAFRPEAASPVEKSTPDLVAGACSP